LKKTIDEINKKIKSGTAVVLTAEELCQRVRNGETIKVEDVDVVTTATRGLMSGTTVFFSIKVAEAGVFHKAKKILLNGVPGFVGPCPNERLGMVEFEVFGPAKSEDKPKTYGGGHLFRDILENKPINCVITTIEDKTIEKEIYKDDIEFAKMIATRNSFKNYMAFTNLKNDLVKTIFHVRDFPGPLKGLTISGCGEINPLEKDPNLATIGIGTRILVNNSVGYIIGKGTRSSTTKPNLSLFADFLKMDPHYLGGFITSDGPEMINSIAVPIPVLNESILNNLKRTDETIELPIADIHDRVPFMSSNYAKVWQNTDLVIKVNFDLCNQPRSLCIPWSEVNKRRRPCIILDLCPMRPYMYNENNEYDTKNCFHCGTCLSCPLGVFTANIGSIEIKNKEVPIVLRQSDRCTAIKLSLSLKNKILQGEFFLTKPLETIKL